MRPSYHIRAEDIKSVEPYIHASILLIYNVIDMLNAIHIYETNKRPLFHDLRQRLTLKHIMNLRPDIQDLLQDTYNRFYK